VRNHVGRIDDHVEERVLDHTAIDAIDLDAARIARAEDHPIALTAARKWTSPEVRGEATFEIGAANCGGLTGRLVL
jgi:hypothetical protein